MAKFDFGSMDKGLRNLAGPIRVSLARRMLVAAGQKVRDEAKVNARKDPKPRGVFNETSRGSAVPGTLANSIYLAFDKKNSTQTFFQYNVSWNDKSAWWGRLKEFGWVQTHVIVVNKKSGKWSTIKSRRLAKPRKHPAVPFLRPAFDTTRPELFPTMLASARKELPVLIAEHTNVS
jgi:hypothetical protein